MKNQHPPDDQPWLVVYIQKDLLSLIVRMVVMRLNLIDGNGTNAIKLLITSILYYF